MKSGQYHNSDKEATSIPAPKLRELDVALSMRYGVVSNTVFSPSSGKYETTWTGHATEKRVHEIRGFSAGYIEALLRSKL